MQTLGLASEQKPTDGMFKRLFWPTIENQYDLDVVSVQGFWVCFAVGAISFVGLLVTGHYILALLLTITYVLAATGVRERSVAAAILIFLCYTTDRIGGLFMGQPSIGILSIASMLLLFANIRATILTQRWKKSGTDEQTEAVERANGSFSEKLANVMPTKVWPVGRYFFFPLAGLVLVLTVFGVVMYPTVHRRQLELQQQQQEGQIIAVEPDK
jgi:hypothetical protein